VPTSSVILLFDVLSGAVALLISYYAYKNNKLIGNSLLRYISAGFLLLGIGLFLEAGTQAIMGLTVVDAARLRGVSLLEFLVSTALQLVAYAVFAWGYGLSSLRRNELPTGAAPAAAIPAVFAALPRKLIDYVFVLSIFLASQFGIILLLLFIVYHGTRIFSKTRSNLALMVLFGFTLIFVAHALLFASAIYLSSGLLLVGDTIQFCGFLSLLFFLFWSARVVK
jgi:hypothetical protein